MNLISTLTTKWDTAIKETFGVFAMYEAGVVVGFFSGGHDSLLAVQLASLHPKFHGVVWADTGTGAGQTRRYIRETCERYNWKTYRGMIHPMAYEANLVQFGYPTPVTHQDMYWLLKSTSMSRQLTNITSETGVPRSRIAQVTGLRASESTHRQSYVKLYYEQRDKKGKLVQFRVSPIWDWNKVERDAMINHLGLVRNAFADEMDHSYECMCFANLTKGQREHRALIAPEYEELELMREQMVALAYRIQQKKIELGMIDADDKVFLTSENLTAGWHLTHKLKPQGKQKEDPFSLCAGCEMKRAADGTGGVDPDLELQIAKINQAQKLLQIEEVTVRQ
jgi:3'-phosphoadenosine 5'-phosphosulfate sulfotransferase (PAPS reductase)/FAD synthetase